MTPPDQKELLSVALFNARRLSRDLGMMEPDALGVDGMVTHHYRRDAGMAAVARIILDLEAAMKKEKAA